MGSVIAFVAAVSTLLPAGLLLMGFIDGDLTSSGYWILALAIASPPILFLGACILLVPRLVKVGTGVCLLGICAEVPALVFLPWVGVWDPALIVAAVLSLLGLALAPATGRRPLRRGR